MELIELLETMPAEDLDALATCLKFTPPSAAFGKLSIDQRGALISESLPALIDRLEHAGGYAFANFCRRGGLSYSQILRNVARKVSVRDRHGSSDADLERKIIARLCGCLSPLPDTDKASLDAAVLEGACNHRVKVGKEALGAAGIGLAQASGFGIYQAASMVLGTLNAALNLGLPFSAFSTMSSGIAAVIGPPGWAVLGGSLLHKLASPKYKMVIPAVVIIGRHRSLQVAKHSRTRHWSLVPTIVIALALMILIWLFNFH